MTNVDYLFWSALVLSSVALIIFGLLSWIETSKVGPSEDSQPDDEPKQQKSDPISEVLNSLAKISHAFGRAGPISTAATLTIFFMIVALLASGLIKLG